MVKNEVLLFDGECNLCNRFVQFILKHERDDSLHFASLQSELGRKVISQAELSSEALDTVLYLSNNTLQQKSSAALAVMRKLKSPYSLLSSLLIVPKIIRDGVYDIIAKHRYKWFGKAEACITSTPELNNRFLS